MDHQISRDLMTAMTELQKVAVKMHPHGDLTRGEFFMLNAIDRFYLVDLEKPLEEGIPMTQMSQFLKITKPAASQMVSSLEEKGLVSRVMNPKDRRLVYVSVTKQGEKLLKEVGVEFDQFAEHVVSRLGKEDAQTMIALIERLCTIFYEMKKENEER